MPHTAPLFTHGLIYISEHAALFCLVGTQICDGAKE